MKHRPARASNGDARRTVDFECFVSLNFGGLRDQIRTTKDLLKLQGKLTFKERVVAHRVAQ